jgi:cobalt-zinc-cadmium efflux system protein
LSVHLIIAEGYIRKGFLNEIQHDLHDDFNIEHSTIQVERQDDGPCVLDNIKCV